MTTYPPPYEGAPVSDIDPYAVEHLCDGTAFRNLLHDEAPLVWLRRYGIWATGRHVELTSIFRDHGNFCSSRGVGLQDFQKEKPWRPPSLVLEVDPPEHTRTRKVLSNVLAPAVLADLKPYFESEADRLVKSALTKQNIDGVRDLAIAFPLRAFPHAVGLAASNNTPLLDYGNLVFNMLGPANEISDQAAANAATVLPWIADQCARENLVDGGLGQAIYADPTVTDEEAGMLVRSLLSAGLDTTVIALGNALACFARHPDQWQALKNDHRLVKPAFDEVLRYASPIHTFYRTASADTDVSGIRISEGHKVLLHIESANRDPRKWSDADRFDITRRPTGQAAFGIGIHACVGRHLAALEAEVFFHALLKHVETIEPDGEIVPDPNNTLRGLASLPLRLS
jgi:cytochrome P450